MNVMLRCSFLFLLFLTFAVGAQSVRLQTDTLGRITSVRIDSLELIGMSAPEAVFAALGRPEKVRVDSIVYRTPGECFAQWIHIHERVYTFEEKGIVLTWDIGANCWKNIFVQYRRTWKTRSVSCFEGTLSVNGDTITSEMKAAPLSWQPLAVKSRKTVYLTFPGPPCAWLDFGRGKSCIRPAQSSGRRTRWNTPWNKKSLPGSRGGFACK